MPDPYEVRLNQLRKKERDYYRENPPSTLKLIPSLNKNGDIEVSIKGAVVYRDNATGARHSESTVGVPIVIEGVKKWVTVPSIWPGEHY